MTLTSLFGISLCHSTKNNPPTTTHIILYHHSYEGDIITISIECKKHKNQSQIVQYQSDTIKKILTKKTELLIQTTVSNPTLHAVLLEGISGSEDRYVYSADKEDCGKLPDFFFFFFCQQWLWKKKKHLWQPVPPGAPHRYVGAHQQ